MGMARKASPTVGIVVTLCFIVLVSHKAVAGPLARPRRPAALSAGETVFNVLNYGAKPGSRKRSNMEFMQTWNAACSFNGRARLLIPAGDFLLAETIFQGPCKSQPITVQILGTLRAVSDISEYPGSGWISFDTINGLVINGGGTFHGSGQDVWKYDDCKTNPSCVHLPASLHFNNVQNAKLKFLNLENSMGFHMHVTRCTNFRAHSLKITAPKESPNTDGIHISKSQTVKVSRSVISTGDDCISIGQGSTNVTVNKVTCGPGHGISVGSLGKVPQELDVSGLIVKNCTLIGTTNGVRIKTWPGSNPSRATGFLFRDIAMYNVQNPIIIDQAYGKKNSNKPSLVKISDVFYHNIRGTTATPIAINLKCSAQVPCQNIRFSNINLRPMLNNLGLTSACTNAQIHYTGMQFPPPCISL